MKPNAVIYKIYYWQDNISSPLFLPKGYLHLALECGRHETAALGHYVNLIHWLLSFYFTSCEFSLQFEVEVKLRRRLKICATNQMMLKLFKIHCPALRWDDYLHDIIACFYFILFYFCFLIKYVNHSFSNHWMCYKFN